LEENHLSNYITLPTLIALSSFHARPMSQAVQQSIKQWEKSEDKRKRTQNVENVEI